jgi:CRP-like cAMP-binding protein
MEALKSWNSTTSKSSTRPEQNRLLAALPDGVRERLCPHLVSVQMPFGEVLYEQGCRSKYVYFPTTSIVSLLHVTADGATTEAAMVGKEGLVGVVQLLGGETTTGRANVQNSGHGFRLEAHLLEDEFNRGGPLMHLLMRYTQALITLKSLMAVCYRFHSVQQQLSCWLLMNLDRLPSNELIMTQEVIATMLGIRRESVAVAASKLQLDGLILHRRGHVTILDRPGLEAQACECYKVIKNEFDRLLPGWQAGCPISPLQLYAWEFCLQRCKHREHRITPRCDDGREWR